MVEFYRFEGKSPPPSYEEDSIMCSFETDRFGYVVVKLKKYEKGWKFSTIENEPDLIMFTDRDVAKMEQISRIVWRMIHDAPAMKGRFETFK